MKIIKTAFALIFLIAIGLVVLVLYTIKFNKNSPYSSDLRNQIIKYPTLVGLLNLNEPGDNLFVYARSNNPINVGVYYTDGVKPNINVGIWTSSRVGTTLEKSVVVAKPHLLNDPPKDTYTNDDLNVIRSELTTDGNPDLYIVYLTRYADVPTYAGITNNKDTIYLFDDEVKALSEDGVFVDRIEKSTIMHEWGHLLGLPHVDDVSCIMSSKLEVHDSGIYSANTIATEYCPQTIQALKKSLR